MNPEQKPWRFVADPKLLALAQRVIAVDRGEQYMPAGPKIDLLEKAALKLAQAYVAEHYELREYETVEEANAAGVFSGILANGDTFGDEDEGHEGGFSVFDSAPPKEAL